MMEQENDFSGEITEEELEAFAKRLVAKDKETESVRIDINESEFRGYMQEQREKYERKYLEAQMGILGTDAAIHKVNFAQRIGKRVNFFREDYIDPLSGEEMVQYGCEFDEKPELGFKTDERTRPE